MAVNIALRSTTFLDAHAGEVITFWKLQFPQLCIYCLTGDQRCVRVTSYTVITNWMENREIVDKKKFSYFLPQILSLFLPIKQDVSFLLTLAANLISTN